MLSVIIPAHGKDRTSNLQTLLAILNNQNGIRRFQTIIVEQQVTLGESFHASRECSLHVGIPPQDLGFNKNWCMNVGARLSKYDRLLFLDVDFVVDNEYLSKVYRFSKLKKNRNIKWFLGWNQLYYLKKDESEKIRQLKNFGSNPNNSAMGPGVYGACGSAVFSEKEWFFDKFGGHHENYYGWGGDDNDGAFRAFKLHDNKFNIMPAVVKHLQHSRTRESSSRNNQHQWWMTQKYPIEICNRIIKSIPGNPKHPNHVDLKGLIL